MVVTLLGAVRAAFVCAFSSHVSPGSGASALAATFLNGARYDAMVATYVVSPSLVASLVGAILSQEGLGPRVRGLSSSVGIALVALLCVVGFGYYAEYGEMFGPQVFGLLFDDASAIGRTIWKGYHPVAALACAGALGGGGIWLGRRALRRPPAVAVWLAGRCDRRAVRLAVVALALVLVVGGARGSLGRRPAQLKDAAITGDPFLDGAVVNPVSALRYAVARELRMSGAGGLSELLGDGDVAAAAEQFVRDPAKSAGTRADLDAYLLREAPGARRAPRHVFLIIGEGLSAWPLRDAHRPLGIARGIGALSEEGLALLDFVPASYGTIESLAAILTGLAEVGVHTSYQPSAREPYPSSLAAIFSRLGYRTRFFYGGYLSWQRVGDFARAQGFDEVVGGASMGSWVRANEWGVDDDDLFAYVRSVVSDQQPSFDVILTTSLHPPYDIDVASMGFVPPPADALEQAPTRDLGLLGHYWYADRAISRFVRAEDAALTDALFAITGDHPSRIGAVPTESLLTTRTVPFVVTGRSTIADVVLPELARGSHLDIGPTLIDLCAPRGFAYHALGRSLLADDGHPIGVGQQTVVTAHAILDLRRGGRVELLDHASGPSEGEVASWRARHDAIHGVAWWRIVRGAALPRLERPERGGVDGEGPAPAPASRARAAAFVP